MYVLFLQQKTRLELYDHSDDGNKVAKLELSDQDFTSVDDVIQTLDPFNTTEVSEQSLSQHNLQVSLCFKKVRSSNHLIRIQFHVM